MSTAEYLGLIAMLVLLVGTVMAIPDRPASIEEAARWFGVAYLLGAVAVLVAIVDAFV